jgi:hypothetical protein
MVLVLPGLMSPVSKLPSSAVAVCAVVSSLATARCAPALTVIVAGTNLKLLISTPDREAAVAVPPPLAVLPALAVLPVSLPLLPPPQPDIAASAAIAIAVGQSLVISSLLGRWSPPRQSLGERSATSDRDHVIVTG